MRLYWRQTRRGQRLVIGDEDQESEQEIGGVRETKSGFDAFAKTFGYEPGRSEKGIPTMDEAKAFVESFRPWELYEGTEGIELEATVLPFEA
ncbi:MAG: hypothetical protein IH861_04610 [Chloroflexi bacterium]|nr:hypothetical protein [Chloroflexota bacterium]